MADVVIDKFKRTEQVDSLTLQELINEYLACAEWDEELRGAVESPSVIYMRSKDVKRYEEQIDCNTIHLNKVFSKIEALGDSEGRWIRELFKRGTIKTKMRVSDLYAERLPSEARPALLDVLNKIGEGNRYYDAFSSSLDLISS